MNKSLMDEIAPLVAELNNLSWRAVAEYTPLVDAVIRERSLDAPRIERLLDGMLDFCGHAEMLQLYKKLCRYYFEINPVATAEHIHFYRAMWEDDDGEGDVKGPG